MIGHSFEEAVQTLKRRLSGRWEGGETAGREEMAGVLRDELGYSEDQAREAIESMIDAGVLRYHHADVAEAEAPVVPPLVAPIGVDGGPGATRPIGLATPLVDAGSYWQIGSDESEGEGGGTGRAGQVRPRE